MWRAQAPSPLLAVFAPPKEALHFAPEPSISASVRSLVSRCITADIIGVGIDRRESIAAISFPDTSFDVVVCTHGLEHVDDGRAPSSSASSVHPAPLPAWYLIEGWDCTYENPGVVAPTDRDLHFGESDHVRYYRRDFRDRLRAAGFDPREYTADGALAVRYGLFRGKRSSSRQ